jgi:hypothetical protein
MNDRQNWLSGVRAWTADLSPEARMWVSVGMLIFGVVVCLWGARTLYFCLTSKSWPTTEGTVTSKEYVREEEYKHGRTDYYYRVSYTYSVEGVDYSSDNVRFGIQVLSPFFSAIERSEAAHYSPGVKVTVYYHPDRPGVSVLEPGHAFDSVLMVMLGIVVAGYGVRGLVRSGRRP